MGKKLSLLLTAFLLAGCAAGETPEPSAPPPDQPAAAVEPVADKQEIFVDDPGSPYPKIEQSWSVDLDGDGADERVELRAEKGYACNEIEPEKWFEIAEGGMHPYTVVITKGEAVYELPLGHDGKDDTPDFPWYFSPEDSEYTGICWTQDQAGKPVLVLWFDTISAGGAGNIDVYAVAFQDGAPVFLPVPMYGIRAELDEETMLAQVTVPETGLTETLDLMEWLENLERRNREAGYDITFEPIYTEEGGLEWPAAPGNIDGFCRAEQTEEGITLQQYLWGSAHMDGMGALVTTLSWRDGQPVVLDQHFDWE